MYAEIYVNTTWWGDGQWNDKGWGVYYPEEIDSLDNSLEYDLIQ